jgi:hypothetical protein
MRSKFERRIAKELDDAGVDYTYETYSYEYDEPLRKNKARCMDCGSSDLMRSGWYTPDFFIHNGYIIETKGRFTAADRRKMKCVTEQWPDEKFVMLFMRDNKIAKNSKTFYSDWCMDNDIDFSIGTFKQEWIK